MPSTISPKNLFHENTRMKKLKLDHAAAQLVLNGTKTSTWRVFDDKDLTVNDEVELIDKLEPSQPQTWQVIGVGHINRIIEKRIGDITAADYEGHEAHESPEARLELYRSRYGDNVTNDTPIKMIHFDFTPGAPESTAPSHSGKRQRIILYADGGSRGNPGPSACGYVLIGDDNQVLVDKGVYLGITTNNQAEYQGLKSGLQEALAMGAREVAVRLDSLLVINQMKGIFKVKNRDLWPIHDAITQLVKQFDKVSFTHVPRELNKLADAAVNRALDEAAHQ